MRNNLWGELTAEFIGTGLLVLLGDGVVATAVLYGSYSGQLQPSVLWGLSVMACIYIVGAVSGCHINPAVTLTLGFFRGFPKAKILPYIIAQVVGGFAGAGLLHAIIAPKLAEKGLTLATAPIFSCYLGAGFTVFGGLLMEIALTAVLLMVILGTGDPKNAGAPTGGLGAVVVGMTVALLVGIGGPWTMASLNPARDLGPRLWMLVAGWGDVALPAPSNYFWVPVVGPFIGGLVGGVLYEFGLSRFIPVPEKAKRAA